MPDAQLLGPVAVFARFLTGLAHQLDPAAGWYGVFARRDPEGLRACLDGRDVPPWDVVESMLHDLAADQGEHALRSVLPRARQLHARALADHDAGPAGRLALQERLETMLREHRDTGLRARELQGAVWAAAGTPEAERFARELAWADDDHTRAGARVAELRARLAALALAADDGRSGPAPGPDPAPGPGSTPKARPAPRAGSQAEPPRKATGRPRGARFAGLEPTAEDTPVREPGDPGRAPRGARFAGACDDVPQAVGPRPAAAPADPEARRAAADTASRLARLRAAGDGGLAHAELCAAVTRPAPELPLLMAALEQAGLGFDVATFLWEAACLPPAALAAAADALAAAGRTADSGTLLRQAAARPVEEVAHIALALLALDRAGAAGELLTALARARTPQESAASAGVDPDTLGPLLLDAAERVSAHRRSDIAHALRLARQHADP
ncbi:hypothetical protein [Streptomyces sp. NPDC101393]|uniref:hypothetical protein n=1 Tax=Streptomyces sp. NPDC101393 TaxID=3366141 RepID=UPI003827E855